MDFSQYGRSVTEDIITDLLVKDWIESNLVLLISLCAHIVSVTDEF